MASACKNSMAAIMSPSGTSAIIEAAAIIDWGGG